MADLSRVPDWRQGGRASASGFNAVKGATAAMQRSMQSAGLMDSTGMATRVPGRIGPKTYLAIISGSSLQSGHASRWDYTATKARIDSSGAPEVIPSESSFTAVNLIEFAHAAEPSEAVAWYVWGINCHDQDIGATLTPLPVGGGPANGSHAVDVPVTVTERRLPDGTLLRTFEAQGSVHVACDA